MKSIISGSDEELAEDERREDIESVTIQNR